MLDSVVHNLTHRRFKNTSRQSVYELGSAVANSFFDPRNVGNFEAGEIAPEGNYLTHYPVNAGSNTAGFSIMDDKGDDRRSYYPSQVFNNANALVKGGGSGPSSGSSSDYIYFNPFYEALLNPKSNSTMSDIAQPHFIPTNTLVESGISGRGTNAPSSGSAVDYAMNNPYAFPSNFNGGSLGASSSGSASDYYDSNPYRVPQIQSDTRHYTDFMEGGEINWTKYLGYIRKGAETVAKHAPKIIEHAPKIIKGVEAVHGIYKGLKDEKGIANKGQAVIKHAPAIIDTIKELRGVLKGNEGRKNNMPSSRPSMSTPSSRPSSRPAPKQYKFMTKKQYEAENQPPSYVGYDGQPPAYGKGSTRSKSSKRRNLKL